MPLRERTHVERGRIVAGELPYLPELLRVASGIECSAVAILPWRATPVAIDLTPQSAIAARLRAALHTQLERLRSGLLPMALHGEWPECASVEDPILLAATTWIVTAFDACLQAMHAGDVGHVLDRCADCHQWTIAAERCVTCAASVPVVTAADRRRQRAAYLRDWRRVCKERGNPVW